MTFKEIKEILRSENINSQTIKLLREALEEFNSIHLVGNFIGDKGAKLIAEALKENKTLTWLNLCRNDIGDEGAKLIAEALRINKTLTTLYLSFNNIGTEGVMLIAEALEENKTLISLDLDENNIEAEVMKLIDDAISLNRNYVSELAKFLSMLDLKENVTINLTNKIKYLKGFQIINQEVLAEELEANGIKDPQSHIKQIKDYIIENFFTLTGICKNLDSIEGNEYHPFKIKVILEEILKHLDTNFLSCINYSSPLEESSTHKDSLIGENNTDLTSGEI